MCSLARSGIGLPPRNLRAQNNAAMFSKCCTVQIMDKFKLFHDSGTRTTYLLLSNLVALLGRRAESGSLTENDGYLFLLLISASCFPQTPVLSQMNKGVSQGGW